MEPQSSDKDRPARRQRPLGTPACNHATAGEKPCAVRLATRCNGSLSGDWDAWTPCFA